ncbi:uncharacterized protein LOC121976099 [Zingiber officinale]|uniref:uncharacterized protein LOC121976099 n=1 Tax=Zingiber officinale TaxID=94328 RepID=UPI001C4B475D|nr:uncharacterized protein LOC121976099 [Zingiber officinale]
MRARLVVFPVKGRNWCFGLSNEAASGADASLQPVPTLRDLWKRISSDGGRSAQARAEFVVDFIADKMNRAWIGLEKAPAGTLKSRLHSLGSRLLSGVKPSEIFLKSVSKDIKQVEVTYPANLNPRFVRRRLRHIAMRGCAVHRRFLYGSIALLPAISVFSILPLPNVPFFWVLFRAYSHWRALKGSERLMLLVSDNSKSWSSLNSTKKGSGHGDDLNTSYEDALSPPWFLQPSKDLERLLNGQVINDGISCSSLSIICQTYDLDMNVIKKYKNAQ